MAEGWSVERIDNFERFQSVRPAWDAALDRLPNPSLDLDFDWISSWWLAFGRNQPVFPILVRCGDQVMAAAVWTIERRLMRGLKVPVIRLMGNEIASRGSVILSGTPESIHTALKLMLSSLPLDESLFVEVGRFPSGSSVRPALLRLAPGDMLARAVPVRTWILPIIETRGSWSQYLAARSSNFRKSAKRIWKATADMKPVRWSGDADELCVDNFFSSVLSVSRNTWKFRDRTAIAADTSAERFYQSLLSEFGRKHATRCILMTQRNSPVAFIFGVVHRRCLYALKAGYDEDLKVRSPGHRALGELVKWCFEDPEIDRIDLDCVSERGDYKLRWATSLESLETLRMFPSRPLPMLAGHLYEAWRALRPESRGQH